MGLTVRSVGIHAKEASPKPHNEANTDYTIALVGNPNVGKSTVFNGLTGMKQHTGNWPGKTVTSAQGRFFHHDKQYLLIDLPGTYSLDARSAEEEVTRDFIHSGEADAVIVVCDATCLERNLILVLQVLEITSKVLVCLNLMDEAERKHIRIDIASLKAALGVPVAATTAQNPKSLAELVTVLDRMLAAPNHKRPSHTFPSVAPTDQEAAAAARIEKAHQIAHAVVQTESSAPDHFDRALDRILTGRRYGYPLMLILLTVVLFLTIFGANIPSAMLTSLLFGFGDTLSLFLLQLGFPLWLHDALILGMYRTLAWVVAVMLPPMAIFFPLFTLLEDVGYLPRIAYNLDKQFQRCRACGKQALTMWIVNDRMHFSATFLNPNI